MFDLIALTYVRKTQVGTICKIFIEVNTSYIILYGSMIREVLILIYE